MGKPILAPGYRSAEQHRELGISHLQLALLYDKTGNGNLAEEHRAHAAWHKNQAMLWEEHEYPTYHTRVEQPDEFRTLNVAKTKHHVGIEITQEYRGSGNTYSCDIVLNLVQARELKAFLNRHVT